MKIGKWRNFKDEIRPNIPEIHFMNQPTSGYNQPSGEYRIAEYHEQSGICCHPSGPLQTIHDPCERPAGFSCNYQLPLACHEGTNIYVPGSDNRFWWYSFPK